MMLRFLIGFSSFLAAMAIQAAPAFAVGEDVFVVPRVMVQAKADSATAAKAAAQRQGRRRAMDILLRRLTIEDDWAYLPKLAADAPATVLGADNDEYDEAFDSYDQTAGQPVGADEQNAITLTDRDLELLESGFEVYNEKSSSTTYRAFITYRFKPAAVRKLLKDARIPYSEAQTRTALVLPVLETDSGLYLWEENNPWMAAWKIRPYNNELTPMIAPLGDLEDAATISASQAVGLNQAALQKMAERYSVSQVIVAHAQLQQRQGEDRLRVRLINGFRESGEVQPAEDIGPGFEPGRTAYDSGVNQGPENNEFIPAKVGDVIAEERFAQPSGNFPALAELAIDATVAEYAKPWKQKTLIDHTVTALLEVSAYYGSLNEWTKIRSALVSTPLIGSVQVRALSRSGAEMLVRAYGDPSKLIVAMEAQGLALWSEDGERWMIATPDMARGVRDSNRSRGRGIFGANDAAPDYRPASFEDVDDAAAKIESEF